MNLLARAIVGFGFVLAAGTAAVAGPVTTFYGADNGAGPGGARPNADAALANFAAAAGPTTLANFQGIKTSLGVVTIAPGATLTVTGNADGGFRTASEHSPSPLGFNTSASGTRWLQMLPAFNSTTGAVATFTFANPIDAFSAMFTDTQAGFPGNITVSFNDGSVQSLAVAKNDATGGVVFFGFDTPGASITSVVISTGATTGTRDVFGIDDIRFAVVPEPMSLALLGSGLLGLGLLRRRRQNSGAATRS